MVKRTRTRRIDKTSAPSYAETGRVFLAGAQALSDVAEDEAPYGNAMALLSIHACISYTDALSIAFGERKSTDEHSKAVDALRSVLGNRLTIERVKQLRRILLEKDKVSYQGAYYTLEEGRRFLSLAAGYCKWAGDLFERRPA
jgi:hypothetical protein